ncbi:MAG: hypothetical protein ACLUD2_02225 [Clostridium sp.]
MDRNDNKLLQQEETDYEKRWGTLLLAGLLGTAVLSGCGSSASDSASTAAADSAAAENTTSSENTKEDLIFVNYRDIRDLNPHLYAGEMYAQEMLYEGSRQHHRRRF